MLFLSYLILIAKIRQRVLPLVNRVPGNCFEKCADWHMAHEIFALAIAEGRVLMLP